MMIHQDIARDICEVPYGLFNKITLVLTSRMYDLLLLDLGENYIDRNNIKYFCGVPIKIIDSNTYQWYISVAGGEIKYETISI